MATEHDAESVPYAEPGALAAAYVKNSLAAALSPASAAAGTLKATSELAVQPLSVALTARPAALTIAQPSGRGATPASGAAM